MARATVPTIPLTDQTARVPKWSAIGLTAVRGITSVETQAGGPVKAVVPAETQAVVPATVVVVPAPSAAVAAAAAEARVGDLSLGPALLFCLVLSCLSAGFQHPGPPRVR